MCCVIKVYLVLLQIKFTDLAGLARNSAPAQNAAKVLSSYDPDRSINMDIDAIKKLTNTMTPENISHIKQEVLPLEAPGETQYILT